MRFRLFIVSYSGSTKLYWNRLLNAWVEHKGIASPYTEEEIDHMNLGAWKVDMEKIE